LGIINVDFDATGQLQIIYSAFIKSMRDGGWGGKENTMKQCISYLQTSSKPMIQFGERSFIIFTMSLVSP
jgi:hypothetical protein